MRHAETLWTHVDRQALWQSPCKDIGDPLRLAGSLAELKS